LKKATKANPAAVPRLMTAAERAERDASVADEMTGISALMTMQAERHEELPVAWSITEGEYLLYHSHYAMTLDQVLADELAHGAAPYFGVWDRAVWHGRELMAVIKPGRNGMASVVRFDG
jgi:hypothetical protein